MSNGGGQAVVFTLSAYPGFKLYHYDEGTTNLKNIHSDEDLQTTMAQPAIADSNGVIQFYGLGNYKFVIDDAGDVTRYTWDNYTVSKGQSFVIDYDTATPAATAATKGMGYVTIDGSNVVRAFSISNGTAWTDTYTATAAGDQTFDSIATKTHPWYDITHGDWGAEAGVASDQSTSIQAAIDAIEAVGHGVLFIPEGEFQVDSSLDINNTSITIMGLGSGKSVLVQTVDPSAPLIDYDTTDITDTFFMNGVGIETEVVSSSTAVDCAWPSTPSGDSLRNCAFYDVYIGATAADSATAYFDNAIIVSDAKRMDITNVFLQGHDTLDTVMVGLLLNGHTAQPSIYNLRCHQMLTGLETTTNVSNTKLTGCEFIGQTNGILLGGCSNFGISNSLIQKGAASTVNWFGIKGDSGFATINGNTLKVVGGSGTDTSISLDTADSAKVSNNIIQGSDSGVVFTANTTNSRINDNEFKSVTTPITIPAASTTNIIKDNTPYTWASVASAATVTLDNTSNRWLLTGTTTTDNIPASWDGRILYIRFLTSITVRDSVGNLRLTGVKSATINDTMMLIYEATTARWLELSFSVNNNTP